MPITVLENIRGKELPKSWRETLKVKPEETLKITIESKSKKEGKAPKKGKWAKFADKVAKEACLKGCSQEVVKLGKEFRENLSF